MLEKAILRSRIMHTTVMTNDRIILQSADGVGITIMEIFQTDKLGKKGKEKKRKGKRQKKKQVYD